MAKISKRGKTWKIDYFDPNGKRIRKSFKKKKDAEAELGKRVSLIAEGRYLDVKNDSLEALFKRIRKENGFKSKLVFLYDGQIIELKTVKVRNPKKSTVAKPVKEMKKAFKSALTRTEIVDFRFHDLRHTFASQLIMKGGSLKAVQELLGHKDIKMTMRYAHLTQEHKRKAGNLLNGLTAQNGHTKKSSDSAEMLNRLI